MLETTSFVMWKLKVNINSLWQNLKQTFFVNKVKATFCFKKNFFGTWFQYNTAVNFQCLKTYRLSKVKMVFRHIMDVNKFKM